jgi:hypothetical protein
MASRSPAQEEVRGLPVLVPFQQEAAGSHIFLASDFILIWAMFKCGRIHAFDWFIHSLKMSLFAPGRRRWSHYLMVRVV